MVGPTLAALANELDLLVVVTAGGRPVEAIPGPIPANARLAGDAYDLMPRARITDVLLPLARTASSAARLNPAATQPSRPIAPSAMTSAPTAAVTGLT